MFLLIWAALFGVFSYATHSLSKKQDLVSAKFLAHRPALFGGIEFAETRNALYLNRLHMGVWHGFQEVFVNHSGKILDVEIEGEIEDKSYVWIFFGTYSNRRIGLRLSRSDKFKGGFFWLDKNTRLEKIQELTVNPFERFVLSINITHNQIRAAVNSQEFLLKKNLEDKSFLAIRSDLANNII